MKNRTLASVVMLGAFGSALYHPAFAQNAVGGPAKHNVIGGPVKQNSLVVPSNKAGSIPASPPSHLSAPVKQNSPVVPLNKTGSISASPPSPLKCAAGACAKR
jgi:hypothetical protein